jgi:hypothetical protein
MKKLLLGLVLIAMTALSIPPSSSAATYETFVGCDDLSENPVPAHVCQLGDFPGAYFESDVDTEYEVCVEFPSTAFICSEEEFAEAGVLYVNSITSEQPGAHFVSWYVGEIEVGSWAFRLDPPAPPAAAPATSPPATTLLPAAAPVPSTACLKAKQRVGKLKGRLRHALGAKQKTKIRNSLRGARAAVRSACQ